MSQFASSLSQSKLFFNGLKSYGFNLNLSRQHYINVPLSVRCDYC